MWSVFFVFLSYLDKNLVKGDFLSRPLDAEKESKEVFSLLNGTFCAKTSTDRESLLYQVSDGAEVVSSVVSPAGELLDCSVIASPMEVKSFMHECLLRVKEQRAGHQLGARFTRVNEAKLICREFKEKSGRGGRIQRNDESELQEKVLKRSKRGFTYPGTLWCGAGNMADHYDQLGEFAETDSCCRVHDHCPHVIHAFSSNYGYTNFKWHSICHCDCDESLKACLRKVNDTASRVVGQAFFNVIGAPCFEFTYEEQCAERHWYGICKRYDKFPVAVLREAVPYDFGGIDIIDELPLPTPKDSQERKKEDKESTTQSMISGPEEPSLTNVVTAAEDFIKVLATVSTSQSSTTDSDKGESQSSEKKKRKNTGKKKKTGKKLKGKGKWRRRKQKAEAGGKVEEGTTVSTSSGKAEEVKALSNFISESQKHDQLSKNTDSVSDSGFEVGRKEEPSNEVMKDEPVMDKETVSSGPSPTTVQKKPESTRRVAPFTNTTTSAGPHRAKIKRPRKGWRKRSKTVPLLSKEGLPENTTDVSVPTADKIAPVAQQPEQQRPGSDVEKVKSVKTDGTPSVSPKGKRNRSKERGVKEGRKKRRKDGVTSLAVAAPDGTASMDHLKMIPLTGTPTVPTLSHRLDTYRGRKIARVASQNSTFSVQKVQRLQVKGLKDSKRKNVLSPRNENVLFVPPPPEGSEPRSSPATTTPIGRPTVETEQRLYITVTAGPPSVTTERHGQTIRQRRKRKKKANPSAVLQHAKQTQMTFTAAPSKISPAQEFHLADKTFNTTTSATPTMSPVQLSMERAKAQFSRKKRRKAALSRRQR